MTHFISARHYVFSLVSALLVAAVMVSAAVPVTPIV